MTENVARFKQFSVAFFSVVLVLAVFAVGFYSSTVFFPTPQIGVIHIDRTISSLDMAYFADAIAYAAANDEIAGVVLIVDSPGGGAATSEELFFRILKLREEKPVVAIINRLGASGAYYIAVGANYIYAHPAALVGSIGVVSQVPPPGQLSEIVRTTGPFKDSGSSVVDWVRGMELIKDAFVTNVYDQRIYALENMHTESRSSRLPEKEHIATGQIWFAPVAYDIGLIDSLGSILDAIDKAAEMAGVTNYDIIDVTGLTFRSDPEFSGIAPSNDEWSAQINNLLEFNEEEEEFSQSVTWPNFYYLYIPPSD